jgi:tetratricopeptide (TPR) repeat protein
MDRVLWTAMRASLSIGLAASVLMMCGAAGAQDLSEARKHYDLGTKYYDLQRYADAAKEYEAAFVIKDDPALLFNIGQAYRLARNPRKAIGAYRSYLRRVPNDSRRGEVQRRIADLQKQIDSEEQNAASPPTGTIPPSDEGRTTTPPPKPTTPPPVAEVAPTTTAAPTAQAVTTPPGVRTKKLGAYIVGGVGVASLGAGLGLELAAVSANKSLTSPSPGTHFDPGKETAVKVDQAAGITLLAVGGAAIATAVALYVYARFEQRRPSPVAVAPSVSADHAGLVVVGGF